MYRVLLVDDESLILEGLKRLVPWAEYDCEVTGTASNGQEGLALIRQWHPDILITDIAMPQLDGLKMVGAVKSEYPRMQITVLTGYRDFDYAQTAIRLGVARYLLKPSKMEDIFEALTFMTGRLSQQKNAENEPEDTPGPHNFLLTNAFKYIDEHYAEKLTLEEVAASVFVSKWHLSKLIKKHTDKCFFDILNEARIKHAKVLLKNPSLRVSDISDMVGFNEISHFSRVFKKLTGQSANQYRNQLQD